MARQTAVAKGRSKQVKRGKEYAAMWNDYPPELVRAAIHEAGHGVAARLFGRQIKAVSIDEDAQYNGTLSLLPSAKDAFLLRQDLILIAAGAEAIRLLDRNAELGNDDDRKKGSDLAWKLVGRLGSPDQVGEELNLAARRAATLIYRHWRAVLDVALSLLRHHQLVKGIPVFRGELEEFEEPHN